MPEQRVLVIEDEENLLEALRYSLEREGLLRPWPQPTARAALNSPGKATRTSFCSTSCSHGWTAWRCAVSFAGRSTPRSSCSQPRAKRSTVWWASSWERTTTSPSPSACGSSWPASVQCCAAPGMGSDAGATGTNTLLRAGDIEIDVTGHTARVAGNPLDLKPREFELLALLVSNKGRPSQGTRFWNASGATTTLATAARWTSTCAGSGRR